VARFADGQSLRGKFSEAKNLFRGKKPASDDCDPINRCRHAGEAKVGETVKALWVECRGVGPDGGGHFTNTLLGRRPIVHGLSR
jgi:hypothetical protein